MPLLVPILGKYPVQGQKPLLNGLFAIFGNLLTLTQVTYYNSLWITTAINRCYVAAYALVLYLSTHQIY